MKNVSDHTFLNIWNLFHSNHKWNLHFMFEQQWFYSWSAINNILIWQLDIYQWLFLFSIYLRLGIIGTGRGIHVLTEVIWFLITQDYSKAHMITWGRPRSLEVTQETSIDFWEFHIVFLSVIKPILIVSGQNIFWRIVDMTPIYVVHSH